MPVGFVCASSHASGLFQDTMKGWDRFAPDWPPFGPGRYELLGPPPPELALEQFPGNAEHNLAPRSKRNFAVLREKLAEYDPDVLIIVGGDQNEWFDASNMASIMVYAGEDVWGLHNVGAGDERVDPAEDHGRFRVDLKIDQELSRGLLDGLVKEGFDVAISKKMQPLSRPERGLPHPFSDPMPWILPRPDLPVVLLFVWTTEPSRAIITGERCVALGRAVAKVCADSPKRIAMYASGGLSHPFNRPGWVDEAQDHWFLDRLADGDVESLKSMFSYQADNTVGGAGEDRSWITVAAAMDYMKPGHKGVLVDYFPARMVICGMGWMYWPAIVDPVPAG